MECSLNPRSASPTFSWNICLCHKEGIIGSLSSFTHTSWSTFRKVAQIRRDGIYDQWDLGPRGGYHGKCYQVYTNKEKLERICKKRDRSQESGETKQDTGEENPNKHVSRAMISSLKSGTCIICQTDKCSKKNRRIQEALIHCPTIGARETLIKASEIRQDKRILFITGANDLITVKIQYHRTCQARFTLKKSLEKI